MVHYNVQQVSIIKTYFHYSITSTVPSHRQIYMYLSDMSPVTPSDVLIRHVTCNIVRYTLSDMLLLT